MAKRRGRLPGTAIGHGVRTQTVPEWTCPVVDWLNNQPDRPDMSDRKALTLAEAAQLTGLSEEALRQRYRRHKLEGYKANDGKLRVYIDPDGPLERSADRPAGQPIEQPTELSDLRARLAVAEALRDAHADRIGELKAELDRERTRQEELKADLDRERQRAEEAERRQADQARRLDEILRELGELREERRRPWPGLRRWWRRLVYGEE